MLVIFFVFLDIYKIRGRDFRIFFVDESLGLREKRSF